MAKYPQLAVSLSVCCIYYHYTVQNRYLRLKKKRFNIFHLFIFLFVYNNHTHTLVYTHLYMLCTTCCMCDIFKLDLCTVYYAVYEMYCVLTYRLHVFLFYSSLTVMSATFFAAYFNTFLLV